MASSSFLILFLVSCLFPLLFLSSVEAKKNVGITLDLIHRDSALSPSYDASLTRFERLRKSIDRSSLRKDSLRQIYLQATSASPASFDSDIVPDGGSYLIKYYVGTPPTPIMAIADTGSDLIWLQCKPCTCYNQTAPLFDSRLSSSYRTVGCSDLQCTQNQFSCSSNKCAYQYGYGDGSYTNGEIATETLTFKSSNGVTSFPGIYIGCGRNNGGTFSPRGSGIVGLGGGPLSLIRQESETIGGTFSYCMTPIGSDIPSKINFGSSAVVPEPGVVSTPLVNKAPPTFYFLTLNGLTVGSNTFSSKKPQKSMAAANAGNIIIDSGTTLTYLEQDMCNRLQTDLENAISATPLSNPPQGFSLCYNTDEFTGAPDVVMNFDGADLPIPSIQSFIEVEEGVVCLTMVPSQDLAIFGNLHQTNFHIGYDLVNEVVNFKQTDCTKPQ